MKITKEQLKQIIKEEIHSLLEGRYREPEGRYRPDYRYTEKGMERHARKVQQLEISNKMKEKGIADALAGNPKDERITHLAYSQAYDKAMEEKSNPMQEQ
jgi:hypothetical protein